ncbi:acyl-CoA synthetase [bacterium]|nr:acyl-CoA synthetase [bacterium]
MINKFYTSELDDYVFLKSNSEEFTFLRFKQLIAHNLESIKKKKENVVILSNDSLSFIVNFFTSAFANKNIYITDEVIKIENVDFDFDVLSTIDIKAEDKEVSLPKIDDNKVYINLLTSGSSGYPKIIKNTLHNMMAEAKGVCTDITCPYNRHFTVKTTTTYSHLFGLTFALFMPLAKNYTISLDKMYYPEKTPMCDYIIVSTPSFLDSIKNNNIKFPSSPKYIITAGSRLKKETFEYFEKDQHIIEIYGSTETGIIGYRTNSFDEELTLFSEVNITPCEEGSIVNTPYAINNEILIHDAIEVKGRKILLKNRTDRLLKIQEKRISAESMESKLRESELVNDAFCFKKTDKIACLCALSTEGKNYLLKNGIVELTKELKQHAKKTFEIIPQRWKFIDTIPVTNRGKIDVEFIAHIFDINFSFPIVLERKWYENRIRYKLYFYPNSNFYSGHFPSQPITPGVAQLYLASFLGSHYFKEQLTDGQMKKIKFSNIIKEGDIVDLELIKTDNTVSYEYKTEDEVFSSGQFSCDNILAGEEE